MPASSSPQISAIITLFVGGVVYVALEGVITNSFMFFTLTLIMLIYLCKEVLRVKRVSADRWMINPVVMCSIVTFVLSFGIGNAIYLLPDEKTTLVGVRSSISPAMVKLMMLTLIAATAMWMGYWSVIAGNLGRKLMRLPILLRLKHGEFVLKTNSIIACLLLVSFVRFTMIKLGVYGYSADAESLLRTASIRQYLTIVEMLSKFILVAVAMQAFSSTHPSKLTTRLLIFIVFFEIIFGLLSGFKSAVAMPIVTLGFCYYYCRNKINLKYVLIAISLLILAYAVIEPFRNARHENQGFVNTSMNSIINTFITSISVSISNENKSSESDSSTTLAILARSSLSYIASLGIEYEDTNQYSENTPAFLRDIFLSPLYAIVPRALWSSKESSRHGQWYVQEVMGFHDNVTTSVGMSPITYLYFAGGWITVFLGFYFVGITQRIVAVTLLDYGGVVYLMLMSGIVSIDSVYYSFVLDNIRMIPVLMIFFVIIYRRVSNLNNSHQQHFEISVRD